MTRIDFYVLPGDEPKGREQLACRLADKAYQLGHRVYIHTDNTSQTQQMDKLLWTFRQNSFVPHALLEDGEESPPPVILGNSDEPGDHADVLINLSHAVPEFFSRFERVTEVISQIPEHVKLGRDRYKFYKDRGYELKTHKLNE